MQQRRTVSRARWRTEAAAVALAGLLALGAGACGDDNGATGPPVSTGTYALASVNGSALPFTVPNTGNDRVVVQSATLTLTDLQTFSLSGQGTLNDEPQSVLADEGTYTQSDDRVTFQSTALNGAAYVGTTNGDTLTITLPAAVLGASSGTLSFEFRK
jgi:hypothetical protein